MRAERRRRGDLVAAAALAVVLVAAATGLWSTSEVAATTSVPAAVAAPAPPPAAGVPAAFTEAWRAPSGATPVPVVSASSVVTADGSTVTGHDPATGAPTWTYARDVPLCTAASGFPGTDEGAGRVLALYAHGPDWCSELTALRPDTGARAGAANPNIRPGTRLLAAGSAVLGTGPDYLEVLRSDLVKTTEYGVVTAPAQPDRQDRPGCAYGSIALTTSRFGALERCPTQANDRLTVLAAVSEGADQPQQEFSVELPGTGATLVALSADRVAVALPGPPRLLVFDRSGALVDTVSLDVPDGELGADPPARAAAVYSADDQVYWWTGSRTLALDAVALTPVWTVAGALGPALPYAGALLVPVPGGLAEVDPADGTTLRTVPVRRDDPLAPVRLDATGEVLVEQRGPELVALLPTP